MDIKEKQAIWLKEKPLFEAELIHSHLLPFFHFNENTGDYEFKSESINNTDEEDRKVAYESLSTGWAMWLRAKRTAKAVPEGFVLVPVKEIKTWYLDDSENMYREDPDWLCDIPIGEILEVEHRVSYELDQDPVFAAIQWDEENGDVGYYETFKSKAEAEKVAAHCKAMIEAQEQSHENG